jgi:hypothetical protein
MIGFVVWVLTTGWFRRSRLKLASEFQNKLLERIGSLNDLNEFLQTEGGKKLMDGLAYDMPSTKPQDSILRTIQLGIVCGSLGASFLLLRLYFGRAYADFGDYEVLTIVAAIGLALGVGFLLSAIVSYQLGARMGVFNRGDAARG